MSNILEFLSLQNPNVRYVAIGMILLGISAGVIGCFTLLRKRALVGDAVAHSVLPGVCIAFMVSGTKSMAVLLPGAVLSGWLSLLCIDYIVSHSRIKADAAIGLVLSVFFGIGIFLLTIIQQSGNAAQAGLDKFLFGKAAALIGNDVWTLGIAALFIVLMVVLFYRPFKIVSFDPQFAHSIGLPVRRLEMLLAGLTVMAVALGIQAVGVVLMAAMLITPAAAARYWTDRLGVMLVLSAVFGAFAGIAGSYISYTAPSMPTGPWVVVTLSAIVFFSLLFAPKKGLFMQYLRRYRNRQKIRRENVLKIFYQLGEHNQLFLAGRSNQELTDRRAMPDAELQQGLNDLAAQGSIVLDTSGWHLTESGLQKARRLVRIHRLWEVYLSHKLQLPPDHVHETADALEHIITPELEKLLESQLEYPHADPHNNPIPY